MVVPVRVRRSHRVAAPASPATSVPNAACHRTPCCGVTMTAAYRDPLDRFSLRITPALAHGWLASCVTTRATTDPSPDIGRYAKLNVSLGWGMSPKNLLAETNQPDSTMVRTTPSPRHHAVPRNEVSLVSSARSGNLAAITPPGPVRRTPPS